MSANKKIWLIAAAAVVILSLGYTFRPMTMNDLGKQPNFLGTVKEASDTSILVAVDEGEDELKTSDLIRVSLKVKLKDSMTDFIEGDHVKVYYNGELGESYPAQANSVYAILLLSAKED